MHRSNPCPGPLNRRDLLRMGLLGAGGLALPDVLRLQAASAAAGPALPPDTSVILLFCHGGPSHLDTYDLKPEAPSEYRGPFKPIKTNVSGMEISELFPLQAKIADKFSLIRSVSHGNFGHQDGAQAFMTGRPITGVRDKPENPDWIAVTARLREERSGTLPPSIGLPPVEYSGPGFLGPSYAPFVVQGDPDNAVFAVQDLPFGDAAYTGRLERRQRIRISVDAMRADLHASAEEQAHDRFYQKAIDMTAGGEAARAFDLKREADAVRDRYGRNRWGQSCLIARRLVEAGVSVVTAALYSADKSPSSNWDDHAVNWHIFDAMRQRAPFYDQAVSALIQDLYQRGLDKKTLLIVTGEFGRTPKIEYTNGRPGRDHYAHAMSILVSGGGMKMGQVVGSTDSLGEHPDERPLTPAHFCETVYRHLGIDTSQEFIDHSGRPMRILPPAEPISELL
jgi:hypothetical protein